MNSIAIFLTLTTVAAIAICYHAAANTNTAVEVAQITIPIMVLVDTQPGTGSLAGIEPANTEILHLSRAKNVLADWKKDQLPPRPSLPGGSR